MQEITGLENLGNLYLELGIVGFVIVCFMGIFMFMVFKLIRKLDKIYNVLYDQNTNFLTLQSSFDIIELVLLQSKYGLIDALIRIYETNNIHDDVRQDLIKNNLLILSKNFNSRDLAILSKLNYKSTTLDKYLRTKTNYEKFANTIFNNLKLGFSPEDIVVILNNEFNKLISDIQNNIEHSN